MTGRQPGTIPATRHPRAVRLPESVGHLGLTPVWPFPASWSTREEQLVVGRAVLSQGGDHVEAVAAVGDMHRSKSASCAG